MGNKKRLVLAALLILLLGEWVAAFLGRHGVQEPVYRGNPLGYWLSERRLGFNGDYEAMKYLGTNAVPWLLCEASAHEIGLISMLKEQARDHLRMTTVTASERQHRAKRGFAFLGAAGAMAVTQGLTNSDPWIRFGCVGQWEVGQKYPDIYVPALLQALHDPEPMVRARAANAIGMVHQQSEKAVPALIQLLDDPDRNVRSMAALGLSLYDKDAKAAVPALLQHLSNCTPDFKFFATNALRAIGPVKR